MVQRLSYNSVKEYIEHVGYILVSSEYQNAHEKLLIKCGVGHHFDMCWSNFQQGQRCPYCAGKALLSFRHVKGVFETIGYSLLSKTYKNVHSKLRIRCDRGHVYQATLANFKTGHRCPVCACRIIYSQVQKHIQQQGYVLLSKEYKNSYSNLDVECNEGHQYQVTWNNFRCGQRCPRCQISKGEEFLLQLLRLLYPEKKIIRQKRLRKGKWALRLDFYLPALKIGIEYDGQQHFQPVQFGGISMKEAELALVDQQIRDKKKEQLCQKQGIRLIRFSYDEDLNIRCVSEKMSTPQ